jgi:hypothetical protein
MEPQTDNVVSLKEYVLAEINALRRDMDSKFEAQQREVETALAAQNKRFEAVNEFRGTLSDQASRFVTRDEMQSQFKPALEDIRVLRDAKSNLEGKASQTSMMVAAVLGAVGAITGILTLIMKFSG